MPDPQVPASLKEMKRRELLKTLAGGGVLGASIILPGKWSRPLINKGLLPGHAQTSQPTCPIVIDPGFEFINQLEQFQATFGVSFLPAGVTVTSVEVRTNSIQGDASKQANFTSLGTSTEISEDAGTFTAIFRTLDNFPQNGDTLLLVVTLSAAVSGCGQVFNSPEFTFIDQRPT